MSVHVVQPREVPLGGLRSMTVRRTLPTRGRTTVGAWCFVDHYGPDDVAETEARAKETLAPPSAPPSAMVVPPHPHTGLQTVSWLFSGEIEHRDSAGFRAVVRPGEMNLMTAGRGISHSEVSTPGTTTLHGAQLWVALPDADRAVAPGFEHYVPPVTSGHGWWARVFLGSVLGETSPVTTYSGLLGAEVTLAAGTRLTVPVDPAFEHGVLVDTGSLVLDHTRLAAAELGVVGAGRNTLQLHADEPARVLLLGGVPLGERLVMWWNFVGRSHEEIVEYRREWQALLEGGAQTRFVLPDDDRNPGIPAPELPRGVRLTPRS